MSKDNNISNWKVWKEYETQTLDESTSDYLVPYEYWQTKDKLTPWIEVKRDTIVIDHVHDTTAGQWGQISYDDLTDKPATYTPKYFQSAPSTWSAWYTAGDFTITVWFEPKKIDIRCAWPSSNEWFSTWVAFVDEDDNLKNGCVYQDWLAWNQFITNATKIIEIKAWTAVTTAYVKSISSTAFVLTVDNNNWNFNPLITVEW